MLYGSNGGALGVKAGWENGIKPALKWTYNTVEITGHDLKLGTNDGRDKGSNPGQRALVHDEGDKLVINYGGDFEGGVVISGNKTIIDNKVGIGTETPTSILTINGGKTNSTGISVKSGDVDLILTHDESSNAGKIHVLAGGSSNFIGSIPYTLLLQPQGGSVAIGTNNPDISYSLDVRGAAHFCKVVVKSQGWCDFVFDDNYPLMPLDELKTFIAKNKHLPGIPAEKEIQENDIDLAKMNNLLLQKIEELTLYILQLNEEIEKLKNMIYE